MRAPAWMWMDVVIFPLPGQLQLQTHFQSIIARAATLVTDNETENIHIILAYIFPAIAHRVMTYLWWT